MFRPGDKVVLVKESTCPSHIKDPSLGRFSIRPSDPRPILGEVYTVLLVADGGACGEGLHLQEVGCRNKHGWCSGKFRKLAEPDAENEFDFRKELGKGKQRDVVKT